MRAVLALLMLAALSGCASDPERFAASDRASCGAAGAKPATAAHNDCLAKREQARKDGARRILQGMPITGYGPMRF